MLKRLSNRSEAYVHDLLGPAAARHGAEIYRKVRIADVLDIHYLNSREFGRFALMGHLDFVVTDRSHHPQFAIEFDGGGHDDKNDHVKDEICRRSDLALFRLTPSSSRVKIREASFVAYLVDVWFYGQEFARMRVAGDIGPDEPFMMSGFLKPDAKNIFDSEFVYTFGAMGRLTRLLNTGNPLEHLNATSLSMIGRKANMQRSPVTAICAVAIASHSARSAGERSTPSRRRGSSANSATHLRITIYAKRSKPSGLIRAQRARWPKSQKKSRT